MITHRRARQDHDHGDLADGPSHCPRVVPVSARVAWTEQRASAAMRVAREGHASGARRHASRASGAGIAGPRERARRGVRRGAAPRAKQ